MYKSSKVLSLEKQKICLLIAHPDDECMFFGPIIQALSKDKSNYFYVLCMTTGNYYGLGKVRIKELEASLLNMIGKSLKLVNIVDNSDLPDHPTASWNKEVCQRIIQSFIEENEIDTIITFDSHGISSHPNHSFLYNSIKCLYFKRRPSIYILETVNLIRKYSLIFDIFLSLCLSRNLIAVSSPFEYLVTFKSMIKHRSQLVWFRFLYIITSRYMFINTLKKI